MKKNNAIYAGKMRKTSIKTTPKAPKALGNLVAIAQRWRPKFRKGVAPPGHKAQQPVSGTSSCSLLWG
ncbi:MAG: hypothetical protein RL748_873 [Pseudomonadota bacterium]|jgi:hypothetical protein